jgi:hypothetical protein
MIVKLKFVEWAVAKMTQNLAENDFYSCRVSKPANKRIVYRIVSCTPYEGLHNRPCAITLIHAVCPARVVGVT